MLNEATPAAKRLPACTILCFSASRLPSRRTGKAPSPGERRGRERDWGRTGGAGGAGRETEPEGDIRDEGGQGAILFESGERGIGGGRCGFYFVFMAFGLIFRLDDQNHWSR